MSQQPLVDQGLLMFEASLSHFRHTTLGRTSLDERSARRRDLSLPDNTQHSQQTDIHAPGGIRTHNPSKRMATDPRIIPRGYCDRLYVVVCTEISSIEFSIQNDQVPVPCVDVSRVGHYCVQNTGRSREEKMTLSAWNWTPVSLSFYPQRSHYNDWAIPVLNIRYCPVCVSCRKWYTGIDYFCCCLQHPDLRKWLSS
jgi:hypothetical protein